MTYGKVYDVVGYAYDAALHCVACAQVRFGDRLRDDCGAPLAP